MRLKSLYLKNYANIYNAMAKTELFIDFTLCKHNVVVIRSENGSGKSSIINELHPFFSNPIVWMEDVEIIKRIEFFLNDNSILTITYNGWRAINTKPKTSKCSILRTYTNAVVELNPNNNMTSAKEIISDLLDISDDYMNLASISANSKGIGAMKPSERKRFMALIVNSITPFTKMHKNLTAKYSILKSMITTINAKITQLGNIEVIQSNMEKANIELQVLDNKKLELIKSQADIKSKLDMMLSNGNPVERYKELVQQKSILGKNIDNVPQEIISFDELILKESEREQIQLDAKIEALDKVLSSYLDQETILRTQLENDRIRLDSLYDQNLINDLQNRLSKAQQDLDMYISRFSILGFSAYDDISEEEYTMAINAIERFNNTIEVLASQFSKDLIEEAAHYISTNPNLVDCNSLILSLQNKLDDVKDKINEQINLINQSKSYDLIPTDCSYKHTCPFVLNIVQAQESKLNETQLESLYASRDELVRLIEENKIRLQKQDTLMNCIYQIRELVNYISSMSRLILKFPNTEKIKNTKHIIECIENVSYLDIDISTYREYTNYIILISSIKKDIDAYRNKLQSLTNTNQESLILKNSIEEKSKQLNDIYLSKTGYLAEIKDLKNRKVQIDELVKSASHTQSLKLQYEEELKIFNSINDELSILEKDVQLFRTMETEYAQISTELNNLNLSSLPELQNIVEQSKYQIMLYQQYVQEYQTYSSLFEKLEMVKKYVSINGIQAEIMDFTMNQILNMVNQLTTMIFGGRFKLHKFEITSDDFSISFMDTEMGIIRPDISMMSASQLGQLSMIISFVLLHNASQKFNIIRLDEVDNNLDTENRLRFFDLVYMIMQILNFEQAVIISHNTELDLTNCDLIITRLQNEESYRALINSGANIIADFTR